MSSFDQIEISDTTESSVSQIKKLYEQSKILDFKEGEIRGLILLSRIALTTNDYNLSNKYGNDAEIIANETSDYNALSLINLFRGKINIILDNYSAAKSYLETSVDYAERINNIADKHIQLCRIYANYAGMYEGLNNGQKWFESTKKSLLEIQSTPTNNLTEYQKSKYFYLYIIELMGMANYYVYGQKPPDFQLAEFYFNQTLRFQKIAPQYFKMCEKSVYLSISGFYLEKKDYQKSIVYSKKFLETEKIDKNPRNRLFAYENMKRAYHYLKDINQENKYLLLYTSLQDSINSVEKKTVVNISNEKIKNITKNNDKYVKTIIAISIFVIIIIILSFYYIINQKNKKYRLDFNKLIDKITEDKLKYESISHFEIASKHDSNNNSGKNSIANETEKALLSKLESFESDELFLQSDVSLTSLANAFSTNPRYLTEIIKKYRLQNFNNYINSLRINYIINKLYNEPKYRDYKISYLAEYSGFVSYQVFVLAFKSLHGVTSSYFIKNLREDS